MLHFAGIVVAASMVVGQAENENAVPEDVREQMEFLVGDWTLESTVDGKKYKGVYSARWSEGKDSLILTYRSDLLSGTGISGWDPSTKEIVETWYSPTRGRLEQRLKIVSDGVWQGVSRGHDPDGKVIEGKIRLEKDGKNSFTYTRTDENGTITNVNDRVVPPTDADRLAAYEFFIGRWRAEGADGSVTVWEFSWGESQKFIENRIERRDSNGQLVFANTGFLGWDPASRRVINSCVNDNGRRVDFYWNRVGTEWHSWLAGSNNTYRNIPVGKNVFKSVTGDRVEMVFERVED